METQPRFWTLIFQNKFTLWHIRLNICISKTKFFSHKQYLFGLLFCRDSKKTHIDQSILPTFLLCLKINVSQTLKGRSCKKVFPKSVYHGHNVPRWMYFIPCDKWKSFLFIRTYRYPDVSFNRHVAAFFETSALKEVRISYPLSLQ